MSLQLLKENFVAVINYNLGKLQTIWQLLSGDLLEQEQVGFEPGVAGWKSPALPLSHPTTVRKLHYSENFVD